MLWIFLILLITSNVAIAALWIRSYMTGPWERADRIRYHRGPVDDGIFVELASWRGGVQLLCVSGPRFWPTGDIPGGAADRWGFRLIPRWHGFRLSSGLMGPGFALRIPYWAILGMLLLLSVGAGWRLHNVRVARHRAAGRCINCGYDLRATPDRCPECGATFSVGSR